MKLKIWQLLNKTATLTIGVMVVFFMIANQKSGESREKIDTKDVAEQSSDDDTQATSLVNADWVTSVSTTQIQPVLNWIRDIEFPENPIVHVFEVIKTGATQFFQTLFQRIISPNAP